jgi:hypothetical protein
LELGSSRIHHPLGLTAVGFLLISLWKRSTARAWTLSPLGRFAECHTGGSHPQESLGRDFHFRVAPTMDDC